MCVFGIILCSISCLLCDSFERRSLRCKENSCFVSPFCDFFFGNAVRLTAEPAVECSVKHHVPFVVNGLQSLFVPFFEHVAVLVVSSCRASGSVAVLVHSTAGSA